MHILSTSANSWPIATGRHGVFIWDHRDLPDEFHDRYLLTELGSCGIGKGFDVELQDFTQLGGDFIRADHRTEFDDSLP